MVLEFKGGKAAAVLVIVAFGIGCALYFADFSKVVAFMEKPARDATIGDFAVVLLAFSMLARR